MTADLVVIGGGKMGEALVGGLLAASWTVPEKMVVLESSPTRRQVLAGSGGLADRFPGLRILDPADPSVGEAAAALIVVKPADVASACSLAAGLGVTRVLSVAAGVTIRTLTAWLAPAPPRGRAAVVVLRAMPNTPALIGAGAAGLSGAPGATEHDLRWAETILAAVGSVVRVPESSLDAVTGLSGSGPAYIFLIAEALIDAGVFVGLPRAVASALAGQTLLGAARMLAESGETPEALRAAVTSPGGTTAAGLRALEASAVRSAIIDAVVAATDRSRELGAS